MATIIDAHTHLGLEKFIVKRIPDEKRKRPAFRDPMEHRLERLLAQMDRNGVARAVAFPMPLEEVDAAQANEFVLEASRAFPGRIIPFALVGDDVAHWLRQGAQGFKEQDILQAPERFDLPRAYRALAEANVPVIIHARSRTPTQVATKIKTVLRAAPGLRVIVAHMGRHTPNTSEHVESNLLALRDATNVCFETSTVRAPSMIKRAVDIVGEDRVIFGSDLPFNSYLGGDSLAAEMDCIKQAGVSPSVERKIFSENLLRCLGNAGKGVVRATDS